MPSKPNNLPNYQHPDSLRQADALRSYKLKDKKKPPPKPMDASYEGYEGFRGYRGYK